MKKLMYIMLLATAPVIAFAQGNIGVGTSNPDNSAILDIASGNKGVLFPRLTTSQRNAIPSPALGLVIFNTECETLNIYTSLGWKPLTAAGVPAATEATNVSLTSFTANWTAAPGNVLSYSIDVATNNSFSSLIINNQNVGNALSYNVTGLACGTAYYYRIRANYCAGGSENSNTIGPIVAASHGSQSFAYTGSAQSFIVPCGITKLNVQLWGAGGGGGRIGTGGSGAYVEGILNVTPNSTISIIVGGGGAVPVNAAATSVIGYGGGAGGGYAATYRGGGGGGRSAVQLIAGTDHVTAGGGGGGGGYNSSVYPFGGAGGASVGNDSYSNSPNQAGGKPGTVSGGGAGGVGANTTGADGVQYNGGSGAIGTQVSGGGGGGGYYGGGGGGGASSTGTSTGRNGGGGGASYIADAAFSGTNTQGLTGGNNSATVAAPYTGTNYITGIGQGGANGTTPAAGGNGLVVITW